MVEQRDARLERVGHAHAIDLGEDIEREVAREIHVLEASYDREEALRKGGSSLANSVNAYFDHRSRLLGTDTHRIIDALNVQTSDGYAVTADVTLLYSIEDPVRVARDFGWGSLYVDSFVINTFRNGVLTTIGSRGGDRSFCSGRVSTPARPVCASSNRRVCARSIA